MEWPDVGLAARHQKENAAVTTPFRASPVDGLISRKIHAVF
jgi:hypothetical protein